MDVSDEVDDSDLALISNDSGNETQKFPELNTVQDYITLAIIPMTKRPPQSLGIIFINHFDY